MKIIKTSMFEQLPLFQRKRDEQNDPLGSSEINDWQSPYKQPLVPAKPKPDPMTPKRRGLLDNREDTTSEYMVVLGAGNNTFLYTWGKEGKLKSWRDVLDYAYGYQAEGGFQRSITDICIIKNNVIIDSRGDDSRWPLQRNRYSPTVRKMVGELLRRNLIGQDHQVLIGSKYRLAECENIGSANEVVSQAESPETLVLYHGTTEHNWKAIQQAGLKPVEQDNRIWKDRGGYRGHPLHRESAVYLTAVPSQAAYYAEKASKVMKRRTKVETKPVVLRVEIGKDEFQHLVADDDWIAIMRGRGDNTHNGVKDWYRSLIDMGQIAITKPIPPDRLSVVQGN